MRRGHQLLGIFVALVLVIAALAVYSDLSRGPHFPVPESSAVPRESPESRAPAPGEGFTRQEVQAIAQEIATDAYRATLARDRSARKAFLDGLRSDIALTQEARKRGLDASPEAKALEEVGTAFTLAGLAGAKLSVSSAETSAWKKSKGGAELESYVGAISTITGLPSGIISRDAVVDVFVRAEKARAMKLHEESTMSLVLRRSRYQMLGIAMTQTLKVMTAYSDAEVSAYYAERAPRGELDELHLRQLVLATTTSPTPGTAAPPPDPEAKRRLAVEALRHIREGEDFATVVTRYSDDADTKQKGGDLGFRRRWTVPDEISGAVWRLDPGQVSGVIEGRRGFYIVQVLERRPPTQLSSELRAELERVLSEKRLKGAVDQIVDRSRVDLPGDFDVESPEPAPARPAGE